MILLRANGIDVDIDSVRQTPLVEASHLQHDDADTLVAGLTALDATWQKAAADAADAGECWIHCARFSDGVARIGPERVSLSDPLARLLPCENAMRLTSALYRDAPLTIAGPGAGIDLTAAGVFADLLEVAIARTALTPVRTDARVIERGWRAVA